MPRQTFSASFCPSLLSIVVLLPGPLLSSTVVSSLCSCRAPTSPLLLLLPLPPFSSFFRLVISSNLAPQTTAIRESGRRKFPRRIAPSDLSSLLFLHPLEEGLTSRRLISFTNRSQCIDAHRYSIALFSSPSFSLSLSLCIASPDCNYSVW